MTPQKPVFDAPLLINGQDVDGVARVEITNPAAPSQVVGRQAIADTEQVDHAVKSAAAAFPDWAKTPIDERARLLEAASDRIRGRLAELSSLLNREHGKTLAEAEAEAEVEGAAGILKWHAGQTQALNPQVVNDERGRVVQRRVPLGVVAVIVPWNYPVLLSQLMLAPALLAGNTVVLKLPDHSPLTLCVVLREIASLLPDGVLNVVAGDGQSVGERLTTHPAVRKVTFTGSTPTGKAIMRAASSTLKSVSLELGGNDAALILPDATIDHQLVEELILGTLTSAGQVCYAPKRIYVHSSKADEFCDAFVRGASRVVVGDGAQPDVTMGPLNNAVQLEVVQSLLANAEQNGATVTLLGRISENRDEAGLFFQPRLVSGLPNTAAIVQEEQFGPLIPVVTYETEEQAIAFANDTEFGLAASVWSDDVDHAFQVAARLEAGTVFVNVHRVGASSVAMPFGGFKQSGIGRGHGVEGIVEYTELQILAQREDMRSTTQ